MRNPAGILAGSRTETQLPFAEIGSLEVVSFLILERPPLKMDLGWIYIHRRGQVGMRVSEKSL